jgi:hypothetical protein
MYASLPACVMMSGEYRRNLVKIKLDGSEAETSSEYPIA